MTQTQSRVVWTLFVCNGILIAGLALFRTLSAFREGPKLISQLLSTSNEERKLMSYGDRNGTAYGFVRDVLKDFPDSTLLPIIRYTDSNHHPELFFDAIPTKLDPRFMIGIGLSDADFKETLVQKAEEKGRYWAFHTGSDFDALTRLVIRWKVPPAKTAFRLNLITSPKNSKVLFSQNFFPGQNREFELRLNPALFNFSFQRGATDFLIELAQDSNQDSVAPTQIESIEAYGVKVVFDSYQKIYQESGGFLAIDKKFLEELKTSADNPWKNYLRKMTNVAAH